MCSSDLDGFSFHGADVEVLLHGQSPDIAMGVDAKKKGGNLGEQEGAGDQGLMFGFACRDSEEYEKGSFMPAPIYFSHKILEVLSKARRSGESSPEKWARFARQALASLERTGKPPLTEDQLATRAASNPQPSSRTSSRAVAGERRSRTWTRVARACFTTLVSAS